MGYQIRSVRDNKLPLKTVGNYRDVIAEFSAPDREESARLMAVRRFGAVHYPSLTFDELCALAEADARRRHGFRDFEPDHHDDRLGALGMLDPATGWLTVDVPTAEAEALLDNATYQQELSAARRTRLRKLRR